MILDQTDTWALFLFSTPHQSAMRFLLIDASVVLDPDTGQPVQPTRPASSNGAVIGEIGTGSVLSLTYPCDSTEPVGCVPDLPRFDIQFDPEGLGGIQSVVFRLNGQPIEPADNYPPYAVGYATDGFFEQPEVFETPGVYTLVAEAYAQDDGEGVLKGSFEITFDITDDPLVRTDLNRTGQEREAESEAEAEVEGEVTSAASIGSVALAAAAAATGANALAQTLVSGSLSIDRLRSRGGVALGGGIVEEACDVKPCETAVLDADGSESEALAIAAEDVSVAQKARRVRVLSAEGEAEAEVESEAEAEAMPGAASAVAGSAVAVSAAGISAFLDRSGRTFPVAAETLVAVDAASATSTTLSPVKVFEEQEAEASSEAAPATEPGTSPVSQTPTEDPVDQDGDEDVAARTFALQLDTETEVEVEAEAEAEAAVADGSAAAAVSGGVGVAAVGDFAACAAYTSVVTSTVTNTVTQSLPKVFVLDADIDVQPECPWENRCLGRRPEEPAPEGTVVGHAGPRPEPTASAEETGPVSPVQQGLAPVSPSRAGTGAAFENTGRGLFEAEAEAEAEAEVEVEVGNGSAAVGCVAVGGGGSTGLGASSRVAAATSPATV